jgi:hypothetical protein
MQIVYWAHSYREEDATLNQHFGVLIERAASMIINFDPPSKNVNDSKLSQNLRSCDGMIAVLTWRDTGPSQYILYEIGLALRARKPLLVFMDDRLSYNVLPTWILQRRFSHRTYFRQVREHTHALRELKTYMGDPPPARYEPSSGQRACGIVGLNSLDRTNQRTVLQFFERRGYRSVDLDNIDASNPLEFDKFDQLAHIQVALRFVDSRARRSVYWGGSLVSVAIPLIAVTTNPEYPFSDRFPRDFQPRVANTGSSLPLEEALKREFDLYEQDFLKVQDEKAIERYTHMQVLAGSLAGRYETDTRRQYAEVVMGDKYEIKDTGFVATGNSHVHDVTVTQTWNALDSKVDISQLADELRQLREHLEREATSPEQKLATGAIAAAEESARQKDGPKMVRYLKTAGHWAFTAAEGLHLAQIALAFRGALGLGP